jgi:hypothetical protein
MDQELEGQEDHLNLKVQEDPEIHLDHDLFLWLLSGRAQEALGDAALAEFAAMNGIDMGNSTPLPEVETVTPIPQKGMGPMEKN